MLGNNLGSLISFAIRFYSCQFSQLSELTRNSKHETQNTKLKTRNSNGPVA